MTKAGWNNVEADYPNSTQILDFFHCKEHVFEFAGEAPGKGSATCATFVKSVMDCFCAGNATEGLGKIRGLEVKSKKLETAKLKLLG